MNHLVYINVRADTNEPYYVGAGLPVRAQERKIMEYPRRLAVHTKHGTTIKIVADKLSKQDAHDLEALLISEMRRKQINLVNISSGGISGTSGITRTHSTQTRAKLSIARRKRVTTDETKAKMSASQMGNKHAVGNVQTAESKQAASVRMKGNKYGLGYRHSAEAKALISSAAKGKKKSPETIERMRLAQQLRFSSRSA